MTLRSIRSAIAVLGLVAAAAPALAQTQTPASFPPPGWPEPVDDRMRQTFALVNVLDVIPRGDASDLSWDMEGWHGGDFNRLWFKSEGEQSFTKAERNIDVQVLYGRFVKKFYDAQFGAGVQTATFEGRNVTRAQAVVGLEGFVPYKYDLESLLFISHQGDVAGRITFTREYLMTQRLILQPRFETNVAAQRVEAFGVGTGLNNIELGLRFRYEFRRELAPYLGVSFDRQFFGTADLSRAARRDPSQVRFVFGLRAWR
ncbi:MAG: copper resistance protein B [Cyanobacteria bacterium]|nr:copper resistance protein B [Cyanobacteriota bacterium]